MVYVLSDYMNRCLDHSTSEKALTNQCIMLTLWKGCSIHMCTHISWAEFFYLTPPPVSYFSPNLVLLKTYCCHWHLAGRGGVGGVPRTVLSVEILHEYPTQNTLGENESAFAGQRTCLILLDLPLRKTESQRGAGLQLWLYPLVFSSRTEYRL